MNGNFHYRLVYFSSLIAINKLMGKTGNFYIYGVGMHSYNDFLVSKISLIISALIQIADNASLTISRKLRIQCNKHFRKIAALHSVDSAVKIK